MQPIFPEYISHAGQELLAVETNLRNYYEDYSKTTYHKTFLVTLLSEKPLKNSKGELFWVFSSKNKEGGDFVITSDAYGNLRGSNPAFIRIPLKEAEWE